jgi:hypothetical protein
VRHDLQHRPDDDFIRIPGNARDFGFRSKTPVRAVPSFRSWQGQAYVMDFLHFQASHGQIFSQLHNRLIDVYEIFNPG